MIRLTEILTKNRFPELVIPRKINHACMVNWLQTVSKLSKISGTQYKMLFNYIKIFFSCILIVLPCTGNMFSVTRQKHPPLVRFYCKGINTRLVFTSFFLVSSNSGTRDPFPSRRRTGVVYKFTCAGFDASLPH